MAVPEVWIGIVEVRQLPGDDQKVVLRGKGAFTWITCWAVDSKSYEDKVGSVLAEYGLFVVDCEQVMPFVQAEEMGIIGDELMQQFLDTNSNKNYCIFGALHNYLGDD